MKCLRKNSRLFLLVVALVLLMPGEAHAYIGPGAGFALAGSFFAVFAAVDLGDPDVHHLADSAAGAHAVRLAGAASAAGSSGWSILGLDGMDHGLTETMLEEGKLPHLAALRERGCFKPLGTTVPPISPVAWSTFQTGVNPGKHNIFDFLTPDLRTYHAKLSSVEIRPPRRSIRLGKYQIPAGQGRRAAAAQEPAVLEHPRPSTASSAASCACRSPFRPRSSAACCCRRCASPTCAARRGCSPTTRPAKRDEGEKIGGEVHHVTRER